MPSFHASCAGGGGAAGAAAVSAGFGASDAAGAAALGAAAAGAGGGGGGVAGSAGAPPQAERITTMDARTEARRVLMAGRITSNPREAKVRISESSASRQRDNAAACFRGLPFAVDVERQAFAGHDHVRALGVFSDPLL